MDRNVREMLENVNNIDYWIDASKKRNVKDSNYSAKNFYFAKDFESGFWNEDIENSEIFKNKYAKKDLFSLDVSKDEFKLHYNNIEKLLDEHYNFAKKNMPGFPQQKCSISSMNLFFSAPQLGYYNTAEVCKHDHDPNLSHCYNAFLFKVDGEDIVLWADPTSDQLFHEANPPKNLMFLTGKERNDYITNWNFNSDLYPNSYTTVKSVLAGEADKQNVEYGFQEAFKKPVKMGLENFNFLEDKEKDIDQFCEFEDY